ncbi:NADH-quinone oxidoreductase subunit E [Methylomonas paludis]|uniref:NADH-quinone oxidoreductase subunit E n=1 Tax=Methylomonas paludis TaxID=1173101 RepID=A0A975MMX1_9GAMM|nr:proton-conducting transporter membrane subunit [Methylomonas paludis]QWF70747.1 NADH-quinone oxidoreductase subunit E [Methylomonas paludis]
MNELLVICQIIPLLALLFIFLSDGNERKIAILSFGFSHAMGICIFALLGLWAYTGFPAYEFTWFTLFEQSGYSFPVMFYLDKVGAAYLFCIWTIFAIIVKYCRVYLHREQGYKRFFQTIFGFVFGLNLIVLSGSIDMLFAGWEIVGISSFLLIAYYRHRPQPVRNAFRAYTIYRLCDVGLLLGSLMSHILYHQSPHFSALALMYQSGTLPHVDYFWLSILSGLIILAASGKSAQFPFCFWLPRAMEGPTPSSAIFYGALSIHLGVFLLLRTMPIWSYRVLPRIIVFIIGLLTVVIASISVRAQSNIKGQIAYSSIAQVGFMFMELALGLEFLVLLHFVSNAFLRCYQLLVSPSIIAHRLREEGAVDTGLDISKKMQFLPVSIRSTLPEVIQNTLYVFALQEGNLERLVRTILWEPLKKIGAKINGIDYRLQIILALSLTALVVSTSTMPEFNQIDAGLVSIVMLLVSFGAFSRKHSPIKVWNAVALSSLLAAASVYLLNSAALMNILLFLSGIVPAWLLGLWALTKMLKHQNYAANPFVFRAMAETRPKLSLVLFLSFLGLIGFPITPAFIGEDLLLSHASMHHPWFALPITIAFVVNGIAAARVFLRLCMGRPTENSLVEAGR